MSFDHQSGARTQLEWTTDESGDEVLNIGGPAPEKKHAPAANRSESGGKHAADMFKGMYDHDDHKKPAAKPKQKHHRSHHEKKKAAPKTPIW